MTSSQPLPAAADKPASLPTANFPAPFRHTLPDNTAGQAKVRGNPVPGPAFTVITEAPLAIQQAPLPQMPMLPSHPALIMPTTATLRQQLHPQNQPHQSRSQFYYQKRKQEQELSGVKSRKYTRSANPIVCGKCGQPRDPNMHKQYFGNWYCQAKEEVSYEEWRDNLKTKGYGKKKKGEN